MRGIWDTVKERINGLVFPSTLSSQDREVYKEAVLSEFCCCVWWLPLLTWWRIERRVETHTTDRKLVRNMFTLTAALTFLHVLCFFRFNCQYCLWNGELTVWLTSCFGLKLVFQSAQSQETEKLEIFWRLMAGNRLLRNIQQCHSQTTTVSHCCRWSTAFSLHCNPISIPSTSR